MIYNGSILKIRLTALLLAVVCLLTAISSQVASAQDGDGNALLEVLPPDQPGGLGVTLGELDALHAVNAQTPAVPAESSRTEAVTDPLYFLDIDDQITSGQSASPTLAPSDPYHGVYKGVCHRKAVTDDQPFDVMIFVDRKSAGRNSAIAIFQRLYSAIPHFDIDNSGSFLLSGNKGTITKDGFLMTSSFLRCKGTKRLKNGSDFDIAGYYAGSFAGKNSFGTGKGQISAIVSGDGVVFMHMRITYLDAKSPWYSTGISLGRGPVNFTNSKLTGNFGGSSISGSLDRESLTASGTSHSNWRVCSCSLFWCFHKLCVTTDLKSKWTMKRKSALENHRPTVLDDSFGALANRALMVGARAGVLANDRDFDVDSLSARLIEGPSHGSLDFQGRGGFEYTPDRTFKGVDSFTYQASDGLAKSALGTAQIFVRPASIAPALQLLLDD